MFGIFKPDMIGTFLCHLKRCRALSHWRSDICDFISLPRDVQLFKKHKFFAFIGNAMSKHDLTAFCHPDLFGTAIFGGPAAEHKFDRCIHLGGCGRAG